VKQISRHIFCDDFIDHCDIQTRLLPNPYHDYPYLIIENFLDKAACDAIAQAAYNDSEAHKAMLKTTLLESVVDPSVDESIRKTHIHTLSSEHEALYFEAFARHQGEIERHFSAALTTATAVQVLEYKEGFFYKRHADDSSELVNDAGKTVGFVPVAPQRKITTVLFATAYSESPGGIDTFSGGELIFNYLYDENKKQIRFRPKTGDMVAFPSNPVFSHEVLPVIKGYRLSLVQWHNAILP
jgi:SM-20-related protein